LRLAVEGAHQRDNAAVAIRVARALRPDFAAEAIRERMASCLIPARQQFLPGKVEILLDVAHNPVSFRALAETIRRRRANCKILAVVGMMKNKDARGSLAALRDLVSNVLIVRLSSPRSFEPEDLARIARELGMIAECAASPDVAFAEIHEPASHDLGLVAGSFYLAGDYLRWREHAGIA